MLVLPRHARPHRVPLLGRTEGIFPGRRYRGDPGHHGSLPIGLFFLDGTAPAGPLGSDPSRSGCREPLVLYRHRRHELDPQQRPHPHQSQASFGKEDERERRDRPPSAAGGEGAKASRFSCSPCRTSRSMRGSAAPSFSTPWKTLTRTSFTRGRRSSSTP